jgi:hypothetical protein
MKWTCQFAIKNFLKGSNFFYHGSKITLQIASGKPHVEITVSCRYERAFMYAGVVTQQELLVDWFSILFIGIEYFKGTLYYVLNCVISS